MTTPHPPKIRPLLHSFHSILHLKQQPNHSSSILSSVQFTQLSPTLCDPMDCSMPGFRVHHQLRGLLKLMSIKSVMQSNQFILCHPLLLLPSIFPASGSFQMSQFFASDSSDHLTICPSDHQVGKVLDFQLQHQSFQ